MSKKNWDLYLMLKNSKTPKKDAAIIANRYWTNLTEVDFKELQPYLSFLTIWRLNLLHKYDKESINQLKEK